MLVKFRIFATLELTNKMVTKTETMDEATEIKKRRKKAVETYFHFKNHVKEMGMEGYIAQKYFYDKAAEETGLSYESVRKIIALHLRGGKKRKPRKRK